MIIKSLNLSILSLEHGHKTHLWHIQKTYKIIFVKHFCQINPNIQTKSAYLRIFAFKTYSQFVRNIFFFKYFYIVFQTVSKKAYRSQQWVGIPPKSNLFQELFCLSLGFFQRGRGGGWLPNSKHFEEPVFSLFGCFPRNIGELNRRRFFLVMASPTLCYNICRISITQIV